MALQNRPQMERLTFPLTARQVEALDNMLEQLFRVSKRTDSIALSQGTLAGRGSASGTGSIEKITLGTNLSIVANELRVNLTGHDQISELTDVLLTSLTVGDLLQWNGTKWINITVNTLFFNSGLGPKWDLLTTGDPDPEMVFAVGEVVWVFQP